MTDLSDARRKAWATRRAKYGPRGNCGVYRHGGVSFLENRAIRLIVKLHLDETLSEGQCAKALGIDRVAWREMVERYS